MRRLTKEEFIERAKLIHGDKYDYSLVDYKNNRTKVKIKCKKCNKVFEQKPNDHLNKKGCAECSGNVKLTKEQFIERARLIHGDKYNYSLVDYKNNATKVKIKCKKCNRVFEQLPRDHLNGVGCAECSGNVRLTTEQFIERAKLVHGDKYNYSLVEYKNSKTKVKIKCDEHGVFEQTPEHHLSGVGCPKCKTSKGEKRIRQWLVQNQILFETQKQFEDLKDKSYLSYDFYLPEQNVLIEYNGKQHYDSKAFNRTYHDFLVQKHHDWLKRKYAKDKCYRLLIIKYTEDLEKALVNLLHNKSIDSS